MTTVIFHDFPGLENLFLFLKILRLHDFLECVGTLFFSERVVSVWNSLPDSVDFGTRSKFRRFIMRIDFSKFPRCF